MRTSDYTSAAAQLDNHLAVCPSCASGHGCDEGDEYAEAEYRAYARNRRDDQTPDRGRGHGR
jgi:hypothetical protein